MLLCERRAGNLGGSGGYGSSYYGGPGGGHGVAINGISYVTWISGSGRVYGGTSWLNEKRKVYIL